MGHMDASDYLEHVEVVTFVWQTPGTLTCCSSKPESLFCFIRTAEARVRLGRKRSTECDNP